MMFCLPANRDVAAAKQGGNEHHKIFTLTSISNAYFPSNTAFCALTAIAIIIIIPAWCIATAKLLSDLLPLLGELLQHRQVECQCLLTNTLPMVFAIALCSGGSAFEQRNQLAAPLFSFDWF